MLQHLTHYPFQFRYTEYTDDDEDEIEVLTSPNGKTIEAFGLAARFMEDEA